jgi:hypothetical protein
MCMHSTSIARKYFNDNNVNYYLNKVEIICGGSTTSLRSMGQRRCFIKKMGQCQCADHVGGGIPSFHVYLLAKWKSTYVSDRPSLTELTLQINQIPDT